MNKTFTSLPGSRQVGNYLISKNLGEGTFGKVKLGIHMQTQEKVAIKILEKSKISDVADVQRVTREINILKQVRHPNIIQLYQIIETPKQLFLVMEYVSDGELFEYIVKKKRLKEGEACQFFQQIIAGVEYLHELGIVHRDLKPENLLIDFNKRLKLVDFGLSNLYKSRKQWDILGELLKTACGSPCYAAPEMIAGKKYEGLNADIWSCGIIMYAMVCGYLPFQDPNTSVLYKKITNGQFSIPKFVSSSAKQLIRGILTTDPNRRYTLEMIKNHEWFKQSKQQFYNLSNPPKGIQTSKFLIPHDSQIIREMNAYENTHPDEIKKYISNNRHNHIVSIYYMLMKKNLREGNYSKADFGTSAFDFNQLEEKINNSQPTIKNQKNKSEEKNNRPSIGAVPSATNGSDRNVSRSINRIHLQYGKNSSKSKKKYEEDELKLELDNLPQVQTFNKGVKRRKLQNNNQAKEKVQKQQSTSLNFYDISEEFNKFRHTIYPTSRNSRPQRQSVANRTPISFRNTQTRYYKPNNADRYNSLETSVEKNRNEKQAMNRTFVGRIPKNQTPKWMDESERIRYILNKTITGHGRRPKKSNNISYH